MQKIKKILTGIIFISLIFSAYSQVLAAENELYSDKVKENKTSQYDTSQLLDLYVLDMISLLKDIKEQNREIINSLKEINTSIKENNELIKNKAEKLKDLKNISSDNTAHTNTIILREKKVDEGKKSKN